ncbi:YoaK family protein [Jatrophihabitans lederbergiae]|uniref:YoaK family protein n=1 Tax=Jatrophihabitans lederbergiae TaxID=3075547 RepID=A0ABU2J9I6_9ACTN|nr:YoaK family protein [Jatrophihabitans sp. DSM 44399]MDT0261656.1 YoaK family protein [Jatrophihabitans sp. DSM 44399]
MIDKADSSRAPSTAAQSATRTTAALPDPPQPQGVAPQGVAPQGVASQGVLPAPNSRQKLLLRRRHALVVVLTFLTGAADATGFLALGGAFSSVMTGNMVLLGLSVGHAEATLAVNSGAAIISYIIGVLVGAHIAGTAHPSDPVWPRQVTRALAAELLVLSAFLVLWEITAEDRSAIAARALLMLAAAALGIQGSAIQRFGVPGLSSTYLTGTLTSLISAVAARKPARTLLASTQVLLALIVGAAVGAVLVDHLPRLSPVLLLVPMVCVLVASRGLKSEQASGEGAYIEGRVD